MPKLKAILGIVKSNTFIWGEETEVQKECIIVLAWGLTGKARPRNPGIFHLHDFFSLLTTPTLFT